MSCCGPACAMPVRSAKGTTPPLRGSQSAKPIGGGWARPAEPVGTMVGGGHARRSRLAPWWGVMPGGDHVGSLQLRR